VSLAPNLSRALSPGPSHPTPASVLVVGAGIVGLAAAWRLAERGHPVTLVDPALTSSNADTSPTTTAGLDHRNGSGAALGVLMAKVFHRSSGRAWRLRQQSHALWGLWLDELEQRGHRLPRRRGLLLLATSTDELARQEAIAADRAQLKIDLQRLGPRELEDLKPSLPGRPLGGLLSPEDGQLDPGPLLAALLQEARQAGATCVAQAALGVERGDPRRPPHPGWSGGQRWRLRLAGGGALETDWLVLALGLGTAKLLAGLGHALPLKPVLGQALELEVATEPGWSWPGAVVYRGVNLVPRPDLENSGRRLWLGATLEPGDQARSTALAELHLLGGEAPPWLQEAAVVRQWSGQRCHPVGQPAPVHQQPEPGLLIATGHYRNGMLLAPATAEWICGQIRTACRH
jgi:glycine/D-amino acid oxidase-like deaminating enzyme